MEPSHVLQAIGLEEEMSRGSIRLTIGRETTLEEIKTTAQILPEIVKDLREMRGWKKNG
jgi:cysteine desulfurase